MPNRYSHAFVLSHYEAQGFITLPRPPLTPPPASSPSPSDYDLDVVPSSSNAAAAATPSLSAVPALSDSSTASTASSVHNPVNKQPLHSASSSIVTEIYAPQSPLLPSSPSPPHFAPIQHHHHPQHALPFSPPPEKHRPRPQSFEPPKSRFSSLVELPSFLERHSSSAKKSGKRPSSGRDQHPVVPEAAAAAATKPPQPASRHPANSIPVPSSSPLPQQPLSPPHPQAPQSYQASNKQPNHAIPYERLDPTFDIVSLCSDDFQDEGFPSPTIDVIPWEYPDTPSAFPPVYHPRGSPHNMHHPPSQSNPATTITTTTTTVKPNNRISTISTTSAPAPSSPPTPRDPIPPQLPSPSPSTYFSPFFLPHLPEHLVESPPTHFPPHLSHQRSDSSFDSVAPPPIRITPRRHLPDDAQMQELRRKVEMEGNAVKGGGLEKGMGMGKERVRIRTKGRKGR